MRRWWQDPGEDWPEEGEDSVDYSVLLDHRVVGFAQWYAVTDPMFRHAGLDLFLDPAVDGRGLGRETAVRVVD